jgi:hypothetical protein
MSIHQAAAIWTLVFLIGLTGGELRRQQTVDASTVAATRGPTEPTAATPAPAVNARSAISTAMSPPQTTTTVDCDPGSCLDDAGKQESRTQDGKGHGRGPGAKKRGHRSDDKPGMGGR